VFSTRHHTPFTATNFRKQFWKPLLGKAGLPDKRFHDLRHTCASILLSKNVHPKIVQEMLGHSSITITLDLYSHVLPDIQEKAVIGHGRYPGRVRQTPVVWIRSRKASIKSEALASYLPSVSKFRSTSIPPPDPFLALSEA